MNEKVCDYDFSDILDCEILSATQLIEQKIGSSQFRQIDFSDISDDELIQASADNVIPKSSVSNDGYQIEFSDISENELVQAAESAPTMQSTRFRQPVSSNEMAKIVGEKFAKKTVDKSVWAVTLFGEWRAERNVRCLSDPSLVYLDKPFAFMTDDELNYTMPLFLTEVVKADGSEYPPSTLRDLVLSLQKFLEVNGRNVKFLSDDKFRNIWDTLDGLMKQRSRQGLGLEKKQAQASYNITID